MKDKSCFPSPDSPGGVDHERENADDRIVVLVYLEVEFRGTTRTTRTLRIVDRRESWATALVPSMDAAFQEAFEGYK
jgi:hypothetical protein